MVHVLANARAIDRSSCLKSISLNILVKKLRKKKDGGKDEH